MTTTIPECVSTPRSRSPVTGDDPRRGRSLRLYITTLNVRTQASPCTTGWTCGMSDDKLLPGGVDPMHISMHVHAQHSSFKSRIKDSRLSDLIPPCMRIQTLRFTKRKRPKMCCYLPRP